LRQWRGSILAFAVGHPQTLHVKRPGHARQAKRQKGGPPSVPGRVVSLHVFS